MYQPGEVVIIPFPFSDLAAAKRRPVLVLTPPDSRGDFTCLAITSQEPRQFAVPLTQDDMQEGTLPKRSWVRTAKVYTLSIELVVSRFGQLTTERFHRVHAEFCRHFGCS